MFAFQSTFNIASRFSGYSTLDDAMQAATRWARANYTCADIQQEGRTIARISNTGGIVWF